jgi:peroxiredoxin
VSVDLHKFDIACGVAPLDSSKVEEEINSANIVNEFENQLSQSPLLQSAHNIYDVFRHFSLANQFGKTVTSQDRLLEGPLIVSFYRGSWCPYCAAHLKALESINEQTLNCGGSMVAISPQTSSHNLRFAKKNQLSFDLLFDDGNRYAKSLGISYELSNSMKNLVFKPLGINLFAFNGDESWCLPFASQFIVDTSSIIVFSEIHPFSDTRPQVKNSLDIIKAIARNDMY